MACVTHHHACACREERFARLEAVAKQLAEALDEAARWADESEADPCEICGVRRERCGCWLGQSRTALAAYWALTGGTKP